MFESPLSHFCQLLTICAMCLWFGNGMKLYPCSPGYVKGTPAAMAASWWTCCCCCTLVRFPSTGIWYPVGMLMFRSKKKFPNPVCDAGIFSVYVPSCYSGLSGVPPTPCDYLYTTSCRAVWEGATGCGVGCGGGGGGEYWLTATFKRHKPFTGNKSHQRSPLLFLLAFFSWRLKHVLLITVITEGFKC